MQPAPPNKIQKPADRYTKRWPNAAPAHDAYERACDALREAEAKYRTDAPPVVAARAAVAEADRAYKQAVLIDEKAHAASDPVKCACGASVDPATPRCPSCNRRMSRL